MTDRELMQQAFERVTGVVDAWTNQPLMQSRNGFIQGWEAARLAQPEHEPVAWIAPNGMVNHERIGHFTKPLYTAPPQRERILCGCGDQIMPNDGAECGTCVTMRQASQREWQGLTDEEIAEIELKDWFKAASFARAIEAKLKEKNNG